jgi:L-malate glycosyltransferase
VRPLRIGFVSSGTFRHIEPYLFFFRDRGHDVHLITYDPPTRDVGVATWNLSSRQADPASLATKWRYLVAGIAARRLLRQLAPDIIHGHYVTSAGTVCLLSGFRPYVLTAHGSDVLQTTQWRVWRWVLRRVFARASLVNVVSEQLARRVQELGVPPDKLLITTLGVDTRHFEYQPPRPPGGTLRLLCTRTLDRVYDPSTIIRACQLLKQRGFPFELTFAAGGHGGTAVAKEVAAAGLNGEVRLLGGYENSQLPDLLHQHDVYVSASLWDGTSISLLEAMACGTFPIVSRIPSNSAWVEDGNTALMFECGDHVGLAEAIQRISGSEALRVAAAKRNRLIVEARGDRSGNMRLLEDWYYRICARGTQLSEKQPVPVER